MHTQYLKLLAQFLRHDAHHGEDDDGGDRGGGHVDEGDGDGVAADLVVEAVVRA